MLEKFIQILCGVLKFLDTMVLLEIVMNLPNNIKQN